MERFLKVGSVLGIIFVVIFMFIRERLNIQMSADCEHFMTMDKVWAFVFAAVIAGIDSLIYNAGQKLTVVGMKYSKVLDGAFITGDQQKDRKRLLKAARDYYEDFYDAADYKLGKLLKRSKRNRDFYAVYCLRGLIRVAEENYTEAKQCWERAVEYENKKAYAYAGLAYSQMKLQDFNSAIKNAKEAIALDNKTYEAYDVLCIAFKATGNEKGFKLMYEMVAKLGRNNAQFMKDLETAQKAKVSLS